MAGTATGRRITSTTTAIRTVDDEQIGRILEVALDGLRYRPEADG